MTSMVACAQVVSSSALETGSRNKRKFRADPPQKDLCEALSLPSDCPDFNFSAESHKSRSTHGQVIGCDLCGVDGDPSDALKLDLGLANMMIASDAGSCHPKLEGGVDLYDADWGDLTETQLEELVMSNLDGILKSSIKKISSNGYTEEVATDAVLRSGFYYGSKDIVSNIVDNTIAYLKNGQKVDPIKGHCFENLQELGKYILAELICILQEVRPSFSIGDAMWCLLLCDMNVSHACAMDGDPLSSFIGDGLSNACLLSTKPEMKSEAKCTDANPQVPSTPAPTVFSTQGLQLAKDSSAGSLDCDHCKPSLAPNEMTAEKVCSKVGPVSVDRPFKATMTKKTPAAEQKAVPGRKTHSNHAKSVLRQKSFHLEKNHRSCDAKGASRAAKLSGFGGLILDRKVRESAAIMRNASLRMKALGVDTSMSQPNATLSLSSNSLPNAASSSSFKSALPEADKPAPVSTFNSQPVLAAADTELSLSLPTKSNVPPVSITSNAELPNCSYPGALFNKSLSQWVPEDKRDEMIMRLYPRLQDLQGQLDEWTEWANQKVMQAARRLSKDKAELKILRQEKEEVERLRKEKHTLEENTVKKLSEMENALSKAGGQVERANSAVRRLQMENKGLRQEMEAARLRAAESAASCLEVKKRETKTLMKFQSWEKQKSMSQEELAAERRRLTQLQKELEQAKKHCLQNEARWNQEESAKDEVLAQARSLKKDREQLEASAKSKEDMVISKAKSNLQKYKDDIQKLEKEISQLRLKTDSSKIAALKTGIAASEPQPPHMSGINLLELSSVGGGVSRERECVMCLSEEMSVVFLPCAHQVVCKLCNELHLKQGMKDCPSCRTPIHRRLSVRYAHP